MAAFKPSGIFSQSDDNLTLIYIENSNYGSNDDGIVSADVATRILKLYDPNNVLLATLSLVLADGVYKTTYALTEDIYVSGVLAITLNSAAVYTGTNNYVTIGFYNEAFVEAMLLQKPCGCKGESSCSNINWSQNMKREAILLAARGSGLIAQEAIQSAILLVTS